MSLILEGVSKVANGQTHARRGLGFNSPQFVALSILQDQPPRPPYPGFEFNG